MLAHTRALATWALDPIVAEKRNATSADVPESDGGMGSGYPNFPVTSTQPSTVIVRSPFALEEQARRAHRQQIDAEQREVDVEEFKAEMDARKSMISELQLLIGLEVEGSPEHVQAKENLKNFLKTKPPTKKGDLRAHTPVPPVTPDASESGSSAQ